MRLPWWSVSGLLLLLVAAAVVAFSQSRDPLPDWTRDGEPVAAALVTDGPPGDDHCEYPGAWLLSVDRAGTGLPPAVSGEPTRASFVRDPRGHLAGISFGRSGSDVTLPDDAVDTGLDARSRRLHVSPDSTSAWLVGPGGVERWAGLREPLTCA